MDLKARMNCLIYNLFLQLNGEDLSLRPAKTAEKKWATP
jgi:hypothetical protein